MAASPPSPSASPSPSSSSPPIHKHVQLVSKADSDQLLFKFPDLAADPPSDALPFPPPDLPPSPLHPHTSKPKRISVDFPLPSCFHPHPSSYRMVDMGSFDSLPHTPPRSSTLAGNSSSSFPIDASCTPLITPRSRSRISSSTPLSTRSKLSFKRHGYHSFKTGKVTQKFVKGASKCIRNKYRMRILMASRRYRLRNSLGPHRQLNGT